MSFQNNNSSAENVAKTLVNDYKTSEFEKHIIHCCQAPEWSLRKWLKKNLGRAGFTIIEDNYVSDRAKGNNKYNAVHNMVAFRGNNPRVCLVSHTDVCRDHGSLSSNLYNGEAFWMKGMSKEDAAKMKQNVRVEPVLKVVEQDGEIYRIIQDKHCRTQVGGDDQLGVAINTWIALNTGYDMGIYFPTDEEIGLKSAKMCDIEKLNEFDLLVQVDRGNHSLELVNKISSEILCSYETTCRLLDVAFQIGHPRTLVNGGHTDVYALRSRNRCKEAVNMTCGYHNSVGSSPDEYIDTKEAHDTMEYVSAIVKDYYLNE